MDLPHPSSKSRPSELTAAFVTGGCGRVDVCPLPRVRRCQIVGDRALRCRAVGDCGRFPLLQPASPHPLRGLRQLAAVKVVGGHRHDRVRDLFPLLQPILPLPLHRSNLATVEVTGGCRRKSNHPLC
jgi:hypothetical protein